MEAIFELGMSVGGIVQPPTERRPASQQLSSSEPVAVTSTSSTSTNQVHAGPLNEVTSEVDPGAEPKSKKSKKRQRCEEEAIRLRDFGPERQSGRLRILKEYPPEAVSPAKAPTLPKPASPLRQSELKSKSKSKKTEERQTKSDRKKQRKKDKEGKAGAVNDNAAMDKKALKRAKQKNKRIATEGKAAQPAKDASIITDQPRSKSPKKRRERKRRRKEAGLAITLPPNNLIDPSWPELGNEIIATQHSPSESAFDAVSLEIAGRVTTIQVVHASLESMFHETPFHTAPLSIGEIITKNRRGVRLAPQPTGTKPDHHIGSRRLEYSQMIVMKKGGIKSSTFARVMRLVADLPPIPVAKKILKRERAAHRPPVWADSRQELCEALPYYRAFQSGLYMHQKVAFGYLLDGFPAPRDVCAHNARVIISHGGGQCIRPIADSGQKLPPVLAGDQLTSDFRVATLVRAWERKTPLVLLAGSGYALLPFKLDCSYVVLGWYWVSHVWTEAEPVAEGVKPPSGRDWYKRVKVRFDWVDSQGIPWWELPGTTPPTNVTLATEVAQSPEAKRIAVNELLSSFPRSAGAEALQRTDTAISFTSTSTDSSSQPFLRSAPPSRKGKEKELTQVGPVDPLSGLLTPPITPTNEPECQTGLNEAHPASYEDTRISVIGESVASGNQHMRRRLPGDYALASFGDSTTLETDVDRLTFPSETCQHCRILSPRVYREGWICLTTTCTAYWLLHTSIGLLPVPPGLTLSYSPAFLDPLPTSKGVKIPYDIVPPRPRLGIPDETGPGDSAGDRSLWRGWVCENCGRANCRFRWEVWQCLSCDKLLAPIDPYSNVVAAKSVAALLPALLGNPIIESDSGIKVEMRRVTEPSATVMIYHLPGSIGTIYHFINDNNDFADEIFDRYQREAASTRVPLFQRRPLNAHQMKGQLLAQHFAVNSGVSYKYNVDSLSLSFDESPSSVIQALDAITERAERVVGHKVEFNEVLSVLYREGQKMSWHDDGEPGLGPIVAGLSLGSDAVISWRRKSVHTQTKATYLKGMPDPRKTPTPPIALSLVTSHGDIVMMEGRDMQKKYVHRVIPSGFRVAATARVIGK